MAIKFGERCLIDENGKVFLISYRKLLAECLEHPFNTLSISSVVIETIEDMTGEHVIRKKYNDKPLYRWLERHIQPDEKYQKFKKSIHQNNEKNRQEISKMKKTRAYFCKSPYFEAYQRKICRDYYRPKKRDT